MSTPASLASSWTPTERKLMRLCEAARLSEILDSTSVLFRDMVEHCQLRSPQDPPRWSGLTDDSTPMEFSVVFGQRHRQLRLLFEPQGDPQSAVEYWRAGQRLTRYLARRWHASIDAAREIAPLFRPVAKGVLLAGGHAFEPVSRGAPKCKVYFNAMAAGTENTDRVVGAGLARLGYDRTWRRLRRGLTPSDRIELLALDLTPRGRVKLYVRPIGAPLPHLQSLNGLAAKADSGLIARAWRVIHPGRVPERSRPTFMTYHLTDPGAARPERATFSIPLFPGIRSDLDASRRVVSLFNELEIDPAPYLACLGAMADKPLSREQGIHSYVAVQTADRERAIVVYFNPRLYAARYGFLARSPVHVWTSPADIGSS
jgi:hypothetical protein